TEALIGFRSELRFVPALLLVLVGTKSERDVRLWARVAVIAAAAQALIAWLEFFGGAAVRAVFSPNWSITLGGINVASASISPIGRAFGTFSNHNELGIFLVAGWTILAAAGST